MSDSKGLASIMIDSQNPMFLVVVSLTEEEIPLIIIG